jgi:proline dehydrogenase
VSTPTLPPPETPPARRPRPSLAGLSRTAILAATHSPALERFGRRYGMRLGAARFVSGETLDECVEVLRGLAARGLRSYAIVLGESVTDRAAVEQIVTTYVEVVRRLGDADLPATMAIKLTHLGLEIDERLAYDNAERILSAAAERGIFVRLDMEASHCVDPTLQIYRRLRAAGLSNTGVVLQAYLHRTEDDLRALAGELDLNVRVVKGAYLEPPHVAHRDKAEVDRRYLRLIDLALDRAAFTAIATHDDAAIAHATARLRTATGGRPREDYEFQLLYGVRPQLQTDLAAAGYPVRVCVPYGADWYVYFGRRLAERPANLLFVLRNLVRR